MENLNSTVQLLNIRLNSANEILKLQELDISKVSFRRLLVLLVTWAPFY